MSTAIKLTIDFGTLPDSSKPPTLSKTFREQNQVGMMTVGPCDK